MSEVPIVIVGAPIYRRGAYILDKFLTNQKEIQLRYPNSELVLATVENDFASELEALLSSSGIRGKVLRYQTIKPDYAHSRVWNITCGREEIRRYVLEQISAKYHLFVDSDMIYDPDIIERLEREIQGYDVVYSGAPLRYHGLIFTGGGCCLLTVEVIREIPFRCLELKNGFKMSWDALFELDLISSGRKIKKGFFLTVSHYTNKNVSKSVGPRPVGLYLKTVHSTFVRHMAIRASLALKYDLIGAIYATEAAVARLLFWRDGK